MMLQSLLRLALLCSLACCSIVARAASAPILVTDQAPERLELAPWLDQLPTQLSSMDSAHLLANANTLPWQSLSQDTLAQGYRQDGIWLRLKVRNDGVAQRRILEVTRANLAHIEVISRHKQEPWLIRHAGTAELSIRGDINGLGYSFDLNIPEGSSVFYLHLKSAYPLATPIRLSSENALFRATQNSAAMFGAGLGMLGGLMLAIAGLRSAKLSIPLRWIFAALISMVILSALADRGVLGYWWIDVPGSMHSFTQISGCMLGIAHVFLCRQFLLERNALDRSTLVLLYSIVASSLVWMLISVAWLPNQWLPIANILRWLGLAAIVAVLWQPAQQRLAGARQYRFIMLTGCASQLLNDATLQGWVPFLVEPYQLLMLWHLLAAPVLLNALEQSEPAAKAPAQRPASNSPTLPVSPSGLHILVVEDNLWVQQVLAGLLMKLNCQASLASDGREALHRLAHEKFDLVLMDCDLPELDGFSATQLWRSELSHKAGGSARHIPIIAITAHISASHETQAKDAGMDGFLQKPIDMRALHEVLTRWLPQYR